MKKWSLYIGSYAGIKVFIHWTFWIIIGWIFLMHYNMGHGITEGLWGVLFILALFGCVVLHEFGHALTAKRYNILTRDITIYPIGGIASLEAMPEKPQQELLVAIAGPAVNLGIAAFLWIYLQYTGKMPDLSTLQTENQNVHILGRSFGFNLFAANLILAVFNLIPAFPMDGGRVLRAMLAFTMDRARATRIAATVGQFLAIAFVFFGFFYNFWLVFIGLFIYLGAGSEAVYESTKSALSGYTAKDVLMRQFTRLLPEDTLEKVVQILLNSQEQEFVVAENNQIHGILTRKELIKGLSEYGKASPVSQVVRRDCLTLYPDISLQVVYQKFMASNCSVAPVLENGQLIGIVDKENINELLMVNEALKSERLFDHYHQ
uniref:Zinc metalloprotease n=1 Tax=Roseihalotalea indica TaxID=2867963 RepID=A0AA49JJ61_9BACT|nr:site-2 protease family protein [Tunicatimonas sp. TK19036]